MRAGWVFACLVFVVVTMPRVMPTLGGFGVCNRYLASVYRTLFFADKSLQVQAGCSPEELAAVTAAACFDVADVNDDGRLSFEEFFNWTQQRQQDM